MNVSDSSPSPAQVIFQSDAQGCASIDTSQSGDGYHAQVDPTDWRFVYSEPHPANTGGRIQRENVETREADI